VTVRRPCVVVVPLWRSQVALPLPHQDCSPCEVVALTVWRPREMVVPLRRS